MLVVGLYCTVQHYVDCEVSSVITFLNAENICPDEIHQQPMYVLYREEVMNKGMCKNHVDCLMK